MNELQRILRYGNELQRILATPIGERWCKTDVPIREGFGECWRCKEVVSLTEPHTCLVMHCTKCGADMTRYHLGHPGRVVQRCINCLGK